MTQYLNSSRKTFVFRTTGAWSSTQSSTMAPAVHVPKASWDRWSIKQWDFEVRGNQWVGRIPDTLWQTNVTMENHNLSWANLITYKWRFSIAMLVPNAATRQLVTTPIFFFLGLGVGWGGMSTSLWTCSRHVCFLNFGVWVGWGGC